MAVQKLNLSANIPEGRGGVNFPEPRRVLWFVPCEQVATQGLRLGQFLCSQAERLLRMERLRHGCRKPLGLEGCQRGVENRGGASKFAQQLSSRARAETWRQRQRQPSQVLAGVHRKASLGRSLRSCVRDCQD